MYSMIPNGSEILRLRTPEHQTPVGGNRKAGLSQSWGIFVFL